MTDHPRCIHPDCPFLSDFRGYCFAHASLKGYRLPNLNEGRPPIPSILNHLAETANDQT